MVETRIVIERYSELDVETKTQLNDYINGEFGHIPIVRETEWETPDWTIMLYESKRIVTFYNIVLREITIDGKMYKAGGINNVITPKEFRGNGYSTDLLKKTEYLIFDEFDCAYGILLCADDLVPFYKRLKWYKVNSRVHFEQSSGQQVWGANTMLLSNKEESSPLEIDLNGLPW